MMLFCFVRFVVKKRASILRAISLSGVSVRVHSVIAIYQELRYGVNTRTHKGSEFPVSRVYLSNIAPGWPIERQEAVLDAKLPGWRKMAIFRDDDVTVRQRRERDPEVLGGRIAALRPTTRTSVTDLHVAALPPLAWGADDFRFVLTKLGAGNYALVAHETGTRIEPRPSKAVRDAAVEEFKATRKKASDEASRLKGAAVSAEKRKAATDVGIARIEERWRMPSNKKMAERWGMPDLETWSTETLLKEAGGISYNTAASRLKGREIAQARYRAELKRRLLREQRKAD
jgi:hypothetical protein